MDYVLKKKLLSLTALSLVALSFQNCGKGGFTTEIGVIDEASQGGTADPQVAFATPIQPLSNSRTLSVSLVVTVDPSLTPRSVSCQLNNEAIVDCTSLNASFTNIADGDHRLSVIVEDSSGKRSLPLISMFRIDATVPTVIFNQTPAATTGSITASFAFMASDILSSVIVECSLDNAVFSACTSPVNLTALSVSSHNFRVRARDAAGNQSAVLTHNWSVVTGAPVINITSRPAAVTNVTTAQFVFSGTDSGQAITDFECSLDAGAYASCTSPRNYTALAAGNHTFNVRGRGVSGSFSSAVSHAWVVDTVAPSVPTLSHNITSPTRQTAISFSFSATDTSGISSYQCQLNGAAFASCTSPRALSSIADGNHTFSVRAIDNAGNTSIVATSSWIIDTTLPRINISSMPTASTTQTSANFVFSASDAGSGLQTVECSLDSGAYSNCTTTANYTGLALGAHQFNIRATDRAANQRITSYSWTITSTTTTTVPPVGTGTGLLIDLSYVDQSSPQYTTFRTMVDAALAGSPDYGFEPQHAAMMYKITGEVRYCDYAITFAETCPSRYAEAGCGVQAAEAAIAAGNRPMVSGDSYLHVGPIIGSLAMTYDWCSSRMTAAQRTRWANYANQTISNVWNYQTASWGGRSHPWTGWSVNNPGNNYYYSFVQASMYWALASRNADQLAFVRNVKLKALTDYYAQIPGGGSLEGTGYGAAHMNLFHLYQVWKDSTGEDLANINSHLTDSIRFWVHATTPSRNLYAPIGDLARSSYPDLFDYHRRILLLSRRLTNNATSRELAAWWLNNTSVTRMSRRIDSQWDLIPAGTSPGATPSESLTYRATGVGRVFARTGWDINAMWMTFAAGPYNESHAHHDQGSFTLANNAFLAVTNNIYSTSGINQTSDYHNVLRFVNGGSIIPQREGTTSSMTVNQLAATGEADITANLTPAYGGNANIQSWTRNVRFANRRLLVTDNFNVSAATQAVFQVHVPVQPVVSGNLITAGNLRIRVTTPANPVITIVNQGRFRVDISGGTSSYVVELADQ